MANAKRASMREGPLAALFRKTEDGEDEPASRRDRRRAPTAGAARAPGQRRRRIPARAACRTPR